MTMTDGPRYRFTVFTATFDRADTLGAVYASLRAQTYREFEWLIVDDGSTDETPALVERWVAEGAMPVRYFRQENSGKHVAINRGAERAEGELFLPLDSDDTCEPEALERLAFHWDEIPSAERDSFAGVACLCRDTAGRIVGDRFPRDVLDCSVLDTIYRHGVRGEKWGCTRTDLLRRFPFPEEYRRTCIPESVVWNRIGAHYRTRFVNEALRVYVVDEGRSTLSHHQPASKNAPGGVLKHRMALVEHLRYLPHAPAKLLHSAACFTRFSLHVGQGPRAMARALPRAGSRLLWLAGLPLGYALYLRDRWIS